MLKIKLKMTREYVVSGQGTLSDNFREAKDKFLKELSGDIKYISIETVADMTFNEPDGMQFVQDEDLIEMYNPHGDYIGSVRFDDLSGDAKIWMGLRQEHDEEDIPEPEDMTLHVYNDDDNRMWIECLVDEVFPDDPGQGTPLTVHARFGDRTLSSTLNCALGEGTLEREDANFAVEIPDRMNRALANIAEKADEWLEEVVQYKKTYNK